MISVWEWSGFVIFVFGSIVSLSGLLYGSDVFSQNPAILWGPFMIFSGLFLSLVGWTGRRWEKEGKDEKKKRDEGKGGGINLVFLYLIIFLLSTSSAWSRELPWEFFHPNPSLRGTGGLFRVVSPRTLDFGILSIGAYAGFFDTPDSSVQIISRDHFILKEKRENVYYDLANSRGFFSYIFAGIGGPKFDVGGIISSDIFISWENSSWLVRYRWRGADMSEDNVHALGDISIIPKFSYMLASREATLSLWGRFSLHSKYRKPQVASLSVAPGISALYDFDERGFFKREVWKDIDLLNPKIYMSLSFTFDNSNKVFDIPDLTIPSFIKTAMLIEPYNHLDFGLGFEFGDSKRGITKYISAFAEWSFMYYIPTPLNASFSDMPQFISLGLRFKLIPLISSGLGIPKEIQEATFFIAGDFNPVPPVVVSFETGPDVMLKSSPTWKVFFGFNIFWDPFKKTFITGEGGRVKFIVKDAETQVPLGDVIVSYPGFDLSNQSTDPSSGEVISYEITPGEWEVLFRKDGYEPEGLKVYFEKDKFKEVEVLMRKRKAFSSVVGSIRSSADGKPLLAIISVPGTNLPPVFSDPTAGNYEIILSPGKYKLNIASEGYNPAEFNVELAAGEKKRIDVVLEPIKKVLERTGEVRLKEPEKKITIEKETMRILLPEKIFFELEGDKILPGSLDLLRTLADFINRELPGRKIRIEVHVDPMREPDFDRELTEKRAQRIVEALSGFGVPKENLIPVGKGSDFPIASNETPEGRAINRRVDFFIEE